MNVQDVDLNLLRVFDAVLRERLPPPVPIPPADVGVHWHERFEGDAGNRWLREALVELFSVDR
jgi:DNA-binding transcriptional LysR family regulator